MLQDYSEQYLEIWNVCSSQLPEFLKFYTNEEKFRKEQMLDQFLNYIQTFHKSYISGNPVNRSDRQLFFRNTRNFLCNGLDFTDSQLEILFTDEMIGNTKTFIRQAREFDPDLSYNDIFQACRNAWIMNGLLLIMGFPVKLTPSIFAYSMLYPYTDNLIDDPVISNVEKLIFSERFRDRLSGNNIDAKSKTEVAVFKLVEIIETEYSRIEFPEVYQSLLNIHDAQTNSMKLMQSKNSISEQEILKICMAKGGTSVLADGYLVAGRLTPEQRYFLYGYGAYLQLLDDMQDLDEDHQAGLMTVFSKSAFCIPLDVKLNKTYWFGEQVMKSLDFFDGQHLDLFKSLMRRSMDLFITEAIAQNPDVYSRKYVAEFENYSPFHFSYIRKRKEQFTSYNGFLLAEIEKFACAENLLTTS
jgi:hypothetical protein